MFCKNCGNENPEGSRFCKQCGTMLMTAPSASEQRSAPQPVSQPQPAFGPAPAAASGLQSMTAQKVLDRMDIHRPETALTLGGWVLCILCVFPAFISVTFLGSVMAFSLIEGDGKIFLILGAAGIVTMYLKKEKISLGIAVATVLLVVFEMFNFSRGMDDLGGFENLIRKGMGYYLMVIGGICLIAGMVMKVVKKKQEGRMYV